MVVAVAPGTVAELLGPAPVGVALQVLVVAAPQDQRGVRGEPVDVLPGLGGDLVVQRLLLRVGGAGEGEILPDQQALLVREFVEVVTLVEAASPDPYEVDPCRDRFVEAVGEVVPGDPGREAVVGDPVHPADEDRLVVDRDPERPTLQRDRAEAGPALPGVVAEPDGDGVERLVTVAVRPPPLGPRDGHHQGGGGLMRPGP